VALSVATPQGPNPGVEEDSDNDAQYHQCCPHPRIVPRTLVGRPEMPRRAERGKRDCVDSPRNRRSAVGDADAYVESVVDRSNEAAQHADEHTDRDEVADPSAIVDR
jgi:hypothetical protein